MQETNIGVKAWVEGHWPELADAEPGASFDQTVQNFVFENPELVTSGDDRDIQKTLGGVLREWVIDDWINNTALSALDGVIARNYPENQKKRIREIVQDRDLRVTSLGLAPKTIVKSDNILTPESDARSYGMATGKLKFVLIEDGGLILQPKKEGFWFVNVLDKETDEPLVELEVVE